MATATSSHALASHFGNYNARLIFGWLWVGIPLAWGVSETLRTSLALFR
jgi:hypothetical protein